MTDTTTRQAPPARDVSAVAHGGPEPALPPPIRRRHPALRPPLLWIELGAAAVLGAALIVWASVGGAADDLAAGPVARVVRGGLPVTVVESGEVEAAKSRVIRNDVNWSVIIESVVPEGTIVEKGHEIIRFKCKELEDELARQEMAATDAENAYQQAVGTRQLKEEMTANNVRKAAQALADAADDQKRYKDGLWPNQQRDAQAAIQMAKRDLTLAEEKLNFKLKANKDPELSSPFSSSEIEADQLSVDRLKLAVAKAVSDGQMLEEYDHPREERRLADAVKDAELALKRTELERDATMQAAIGDEKARLFTRNAQNQKLADDRADFAKMTIVADTPGLVVYDTGRSRWDRTQVLVAVSEKISPRQQLMIIPDMATLQVKTKVYEAVVDQVKGKNQRAVSVTGDRERQGPDAPRKNSQSRAPNGGPADPLAAAPADGSQGPPDSSTPRKGRSSGRRSASEPASGAATSAPASAEPVADDDDLSDCTEAFIRLDAKPDVMLKGRVRFVAPLPDSQNAWGPSTGVKVFNVIVKLNKDQNLDGLKPGMTAQVELVLARLNDVLQAPVAAVFTEQQQTYVYRVRGGATERLAVKVGRMNEKSVEIVSGLSEGDIVRLTPPTGPVTGGAQGESAQPAVPKPTGA